MIQQSTLNEVIEKLQELQKNGFGDCPVWCNFEYDIGVKNIKVYEDHPSGANVELYS